MTKPLILLSNDDGIQSPGLAALAHALDPISELLIVAPELQQSGAGRSMHNSFTGRIKTAEVTYEDQSWPAYAADASPALAVQHGVLEIADRKPDLVITGINFGENIGLSSGTISGTVGAALEGAAAKIPALAVSLEVPADLHLSYDESVDFSIAGHFARLFAARTLAVALPDDVDVLKIEVPAKATEDTPWHVTRLEKVPYYVPVVPERIEGFEEPGRLLYELNEDRTSEQGTDAWALDEGYVSVTPLSLDMTSRITMQKLDDLLRNSS